MEMVGFGICTDNFYVSELRREKKVKFFHWLHGLTRAYSNYVAIWKEKKTV